MKRWHYLAAALVLAAAAVTVRAAVRPPRPTQASLGAARAGHSANPRPRGRARVAALSIPTGTPTPLPMAPDFRLVPVWTSQGQPVYLNASVTPIAFVSAQHPGNLAPFLHTLDRVPGPHPVVFVAVGFPPESLGRAIRQTAALSRHRLSGAPVYALQGPWTQYARPLPALAYMTGTQAAAHILPIGGHVSYARLAAAFGRLRAHAPTAALAARSGKTGHHA